MAETHRRVEPRGIVGTGMSTDPERIREIENRAARMERDYSLPNKKFGEVIDTAPKGAPRNTEWVDAPPQKEKRSARGVSDPKGRAVQDKEAKEKDGKDKAGEQDAAAQDGAAQEAPAKGAREPVKKPERPSMGAGNAAVGSKLGARARVAFKV